VCVCQVHHFLPLLRDEVLSLARIPQNIAVVLDVIT
jgi:hypothetical protein